MKSAMSRYSPSPIGSRTTLQLRSSSDTQSKRAPVKKVQLDPKDCEEIHSPIGETLLPIRIEEEHEIMARGYKQLKIKWALKKLMKKLYGLSVPRKIPNGIVEDWESRLTEDNAAD